MPHLRQRQGRSTGNGRRGTAIIKAAAASRNRRSCIVGGDSMEDPGAEVPTIVLEKDGEGNVARIRVQCACGRHAQLVCAYE